MRRLPAISDRPLSSLGRNDFFVPRPRTSTSQQCAFASAVVELSPCKKIRAQLLSSSFSSDPGFLKSRACFKKNLSLHISSGMEIAVITRNYAMYPS